MPASFNKFFPCIVILGVLSYDSSHVKSFRFLAKLFDQRFKTSLFKSGTSIKANDLLQASVTSTDALRNFLADNYEIPDSACPQGCEPERLDGSRNTRTQNSLLCRCHRMHFSIFARFDQLDGMLKHGQVILKSQRRPQTDQPSEFGLSLRRSPEKLNRTRICDA